MELLDNILSSVVQPYLKRYPAGEYLFRQGELASTMYFIVTGRIQLIAERSSGMAIEGILETGQFLGEKVLLQEAPYKRAYSALCETDLFVLEMTRAQVRDIEENSPQVMTDLLKTILQVVGHRFELVNFLAQGLRPNDEANRVVNVVLYFSKVASTGDEASPSFALSEESIHKYVDVDRKTIRAVIKQLISEGLLVKTDDDRFIIPDPDALARLAA